MMNRNTQRIVIAVIAVILALTMILSLVMPAMAATLPGESAPSGGEERMLNGIRIGTVDVSGMTENEATEAVRASVLAMQASTLTVTSADVNTSVAVADLGFTWTNQEVIREAMAKGRSGNPITRYKCAKDVESKGCVFPIERSYDPAAVANFITEVAWNTNHAAVSFSMQMGEDGTPQVVEGTPGVRLSEKDALQMLTLYLQGGWQGGIPSLTIPVESITPRGSAEELKKVTDVLGTGSTVYAGSPPDRCQNIENGVSLINGTILWPGETFSLLSHVIPFTAEHGYALAHSYAEGSVVDTYGGGICQVSTTLYLAVLAAELQVDQRSNHSMMVGYIEPSKDAAISEEGGKDLVFTNNTDSPIFISGYTNAGIVEFVIYGVETRDPGRTVNYRSEVLSQQDPVFELTADENAPAGSIVMGDDPHPAVESRLWKDVTVNGVTESEEINWDSYQMSPFKYIIGVSTPDATLRDRLYTAIADDNLEMVQHALIDYGISYE